MKIGVRAHDFGRLTENDLAKTIAETGLEAVQLALTKAIEGINSFDDINLSKLESIRRAFEQNNVDISILGCYVEPSLPDKNARLEQVNKFLTGIEHAKELGVKFIGTETTRLDPYTTTKDQREKIYKDLLDSVLRMTEKAEKFGITITVETVADHTMNNGEITRRLLNDVNSKNLQVIMDPVNLILHDTVQNQEKIYKEFFDTVGKEIQIVHIKEIVFEGEEKIWRPLGQGIVNYDYLFEWLNQNKPNVPILREHMKREFCKQDIEFMKKMSGRTSLSN